MTHSLSRVEKCIDNGPMELFWEHSNVRSTIYINVRHLKNSYKQLKNTFTSQTMKDIK